MIRETYRLVNGESDTTPFEDRKRDGSADDLLTAQWQSGHQLVTDPLVRAKFETALKTLASDGLHGPLNIEPSPPDGKPSLTDDGTAAKSPDVEPSVDDETDQKVGLDDTELETFLVSHLAWISKNGRCFHRQPRCAGMRQSRNIQRNEFSKRGLQPCSRCWTRLR